MPGASTPRRVLAALLLGAAGAAPAGAQQTPAPDPALLARAERILRRSPVIDGHNDVWDAFQSRAWTVEGIDLSQPRPELHTDLPRMRAGRVGAQFWAAYVPGEMIQGGALREAIDDVDALWRLTARYPELVPARTAAELERARRSGRIASLIGVEGGHAIEGSLGALRALHQLGVRYLTLTHNRSTEWADAALDAPRNGGLSPFGEEVVREMNRLGLFVDLSHVSPETMHDALRVSRAPVIFSHSSARGVTDHPRNVPDDVLPLVAANRGVVMVNFAPGFVSNALLRWQATRDSVSRAAGDPQRGREWAAANPAPRATLSDVADHIDHIRRAIGADYIGIGSDFDGISTVPVGLEDVSTYPALFAELLRRGYTEAELRKIAGENLLRAMREMERTARDMQREAR